jgi:hypothetical protein
MKSSDSNTLVLHGESEDIANMISNTQPQFSGGSKHSRSRSSTGFEDQDENPLISSSMSNRSTPVKFDERFGSQEQLVDSPGDAEIKISE